MGRRTLIYVSPVNVEKKVQAAPVVGWVVDYRIEHRLFVSHPDVLAGGGPDRLRGSALLRGEPVKHL